MIEPCGTGRADGRAVTLPQDSEPDVEQLEEISDHLLRAYVRPASAPRPVASDASGKLAQLEGILGRYGRPLEAGPATGSRVPATTLAAAGLGALVATLLGIWVPLGWLDAGVPLGGWGLVLLVASLSAAAAVHQARSGIWPTPTGIALACVAQVGIGIAAWLLAPTLGGPGGMPGLVILAMGLLAAITGLIQEFRPAAPAGRVEWARVATAVGGALIAVGAMVLQGPGA
jgi:hypothetical protein